MSRAKAAVATVIREVVEGDEITAEVDGDTLNVRVTSVDHRPMPATEFFDDPVEVRGRTDDGRVVRFETHRLAYAEDSVYVYERVQDLPPEWEYVGSVDEFDTDAQ